MTAAGQHVGGRTSFQAVGVKKLAARRQLTSVFG
jgi:hypothetical protein